MNRPEPDPRLSDAYDAIGEVMGRLGHSTPNAALRYRHVAGGRDAQIAAALSRMAEGPAL